MVRSSIACGKCRRSKIKCVNTGVNSTCKACVQANRECTYPPSGVTTTFKKAEFGIKQEEGETKKRVKKGEDSARRNSTRNEDPLESSVLTRKVWEEVFEIYKLHFATEMPFLHPPTFKNRMKQASYPRDPAVSAADLEGRVLLLGVLTLTARFQSDLVALHSQNGKPSDPLDASEYYATALKAAFGPAGVNMTTQSLDGIQALLMLGLYEWGQTRGLSAWVYTGIAIRLAQSMGLAYEDDPDNITPTALRKLNAKPQDKDRTIEREVRRRTLWSCFVMDRLLSAGKNRPKMIDVDKLQVQLPCSEDEFLFGQIDTQPSFLRSVQADSNNGMYQASDHGVLSRYIRLVNIFGRFSEWSCAGGRRTEKHPPWDPSSGFYQLSRQLQNFHHALPPNLTFTEDNLSAHIEKRSVTAYVSMHTLYCVCLIMLHREYIPFIPLRCKRPQGPLDEPTFLPNAAPEGFWEDSAETICKASRDVVVIVRTCQDNNVLPESPTIGFAIYQAAFVGIYINHFKHMDTGRFITHFQENSHQHHHHGDSGSSDGGRFEETTTKLLKSMVPRLKMSEGYCKILKKMNGMYMDFKTSYYSHFPTGGANTKHMHFEGGGLKDYLPVERMLKEFGNLADHAYSDGFSDAAEMATMSRDSMEIQIPNNSELPPRSSHNGLPTTTMQTQTQNQNANITDGGSRHRNSSSSSWAAVNQSPPLPQTSLEDERLHAKYPPSSPWTYPSSGVPVQGQGQAQIPFASPSQSQAPSLISPSNAGDTSSTPSIHSNSSPYTQQTNVVYHQNPSQQQQQGMGYAMAPPQSGGVVYSEEQFLAPYEQMGTMTGTNFDGFVQDDSLMTFHPDGVNGGGGGRNDFFQMPIMGMGGLGMGQGQMMGQQQQQQHGGGQMGGNPNQMVGHVNTQMEYVDQGANENANGHLVGGGDGGGGGADARAALLAKRKRGVEEDEFRYEG